MSQKGAHSPVVEALKEISEVMNEYPNMPTPHGSTEYFLALLAQMLLRIERRLKLLEKPPKK